MLKINQELVGIFLVIIFLWWVLKPENTEEGFDEKTVEFVPVGEERYGLRGEQLDTSDIEKLYISPEREIRLNHGGGQMYLSDSTPDDEGIPNCKNIPCPNNTNEYDEQDTCWQCASSKPESIEIPPVHPHVPN